MPNLEYWPPKINCPALNCLGKLKLGPPSLGEEGIYFCEICLGSWSQTELYDLLKKDK